jgi:hypothetical protein
MSESSDSTAPPASRLTRFASRWRDRLWTLEGERKSIRAAGVVDGEKVEATHRNGVLMLRLAEDARGPAAPDLGAQQLKKISGFFRRTLSLDVHSRRTQPFALLAVGTTDLDGAIGRARRGASLIGLELPARVTGEVDDGVAATISALV